jgi:hypothetical protein
MIPPNGGSTFAEEVPPWFARLLATVQKVYIVVLGHDKCHGSPSPTFCPCVHRTKLLSYYSE